MTSNYDHNNNRAEILYAELSSHFSSTTTAGRRGGGGGGENFLSEKQAQMNKLSAILDELTAKKRGDDPSCRTLIDINASIAIAKKLIEREGGESKDDDAIEKRHFGYSILQRLLSSSTPTPAGRESEEEAMVKNEFMNIISNELQLTSRGGSKVPYPLKSKVAQITAEFIKREGSTAWIAFSETIARMLRSTDAYECELGAIIARYVAEDVALHSDEVFADNVRDLLGGMTQTIGEVTRAMREAWERHFSSSSNSNNNFASLEMQKASENCALAVLEAVSVYAEWAPLVPLVRSGLVDICCVALLSNTNESACRAPAASAIKHVLTRKPLPDDVPQDDRAVVFMAVSSCVRAVVAHLDVVLAQEYNALDNADAYEQCAELAFQAASVQVLQMLSRGEQQQQQQLDLVVALLERLAMLVRIPNLKSLETVLGAWTALLRANGATVPKKVHAMTTSSSMAPASSSSPSAATSLNVLPPGAVPALLEYCVSWLRAGGGLAGGMDPSGTQIAKEREQWEDAFETFEELKTQWIVDRAKVMEVIKLCGNLDPQSASRKLLETVDGVLEWLKSVSTATTANGGGDSGDEGKACILEGVQSFTECVMLVLPVEEPQASSAVIEIEKLVAKALGMTAQSSQSDGGIRLGPQSLAQYAKILECFGRIGLVRPNLAPLLVKNLFDLLGRVSAEDVSAPPVRGKARVKRTQLARQKICSAMLNICVTVPEALNPHLEPLAEQVESLRSTGNLTGAERGTLAEALLAVATPSGPERVTQVLDWLLTPVKSRWYSVENGTVLPLMANLITPEAFVAQQQEQEQLSNVHWDLFHDVQLLERCMRRCLPGGSAQKVVQEAPGEQQQQQQQQQQHSVCLISEHIEWAILLATEMHRLVRRIFTPNLQSQMVSAHLAESLQPSWEEYAASLKPGKLKEFALEQAENQIVTQLKVVSVRDWLRVLRDASLNIINLVLLHASEMTYSNPSIAEKMQTVISADLESQRDDQVRTMVLLFVRPVLSRCPAQFRQIWFQALVAPILPDLCRRVEAGWTAAGTNKAHPSTPGTTTSEALDASSDVSTYAKLVAEAYSERTLREISRELGSILELIVAPDGTLGRRTKTMSTADTEKDAVAGGKHLIDWMCSQSDVQIAQIAIQAGTLALKIDDLETVSKAILFCRGLIAAASAQDPRIGDGLAESCGGEIVFAAVAALSKSLNSSLQAELLSLIYEVLMKHARTTKSVPHAMLCIPGITESVLVNTLDEMSKCRSDKKATGLVKNLLLSIPGEELKILATGDNKKTISAIQIPTNSKRRQSDGRNANTNDSGTSWTENEVHAGFQLFQ